MADEKYTFQLGNFEIKVLSDYTREGPMDMSSMFPSVGSDELKRVMAEHQFDPENVILSFNCLYVDTGDHKILIDTGSGREVGGRFLDHLDSEGIGYNSIDHIVFTHGHADHIGGVTDADGELVFPNAEYWMWADEWEYWQDKSNMENEPPHAIAGAEKNLPAVADRLTLLRDEGEFLPGLTALHAPGHTIGLMAIALESENEKLLVAADSFHMPFQIEHLEMLANSDRNPELVPDSRKKLLRYCVQNSAKLHVYHFPHPGLGVVTSEDDTFKWEASS